MKTKDLNNLRQRADHQNKSVEEQVWEVLESMVAEDPGAHFSIFSESGKISVLFFQTAYMKKMLNSYPDVLYIDSTYCLNLYGYPVVVFMIVDGDNVGHCVGYACVRDEKMMTLSVLFGEFVRKNEGVKVKTVVVDKDASEIGAVRQTMPECNVVLCRFHVAKTLMEAVRKYCGRGEQEEVTQVVRRMMMCAKEEEFFNCFNLIPNGLFKTYLEKNWLPVSNTWANYKTKEILTWGNKTNNFVERHNRALKTVGHSKMGIPAFIRSLLAYHKSTEKQVRRKFQELQLRSKIFRPQFEAAKEILSASYAKLTPYACEEIKKQLNKLHGQVVAYDADSKTLAVSNNGEEIHYSVGDTCQCLHYVEKQLPCWHVLAYCQYENVSPLANVPERYLKERLLRCFEGEEESDGGVVSAEIDVISASRERSEWEKRMTLKEACRELVAVGVRCGQLVFEKRMRTVRKLIAMWREDKDVEIEDVLEFADDMVEMERNVQFQKRVGRGVGVDDVVEEAEEEGGINFEAEVISQEGITVGEEDLIDEVGGDNKIGDALECPEMERGIVRVEEVLQEMETVGGDDVRVGLNQETKRVVEVDVTVNEAMPQERETVGGDDVGVGLRHEMEAPGVNFSFLQTTAEIHSFGDRVSICYGDKKNSFGKFERAKTKGRPRGAGVTCNRKRKQTVCRPMSKGKRLKTVGAMKEDICGVCGKEELDKDLCEGGSLMEWIDCDVCHQWYHCLCVGLKSAASYFHCASCKS